MKIISIICLCFYSIYTFSYSGPINNYQTSKTLISSSYETQSSDQFNIQGTWSLTKRRCLSGAIVLDGYDPRLDRTQISYSENKFQYDSIVGGCKYSSKGSYELNGPFVIYKNIRSSSSCGGINYKTREQNIYKLDTNSLAFYFGPFTQGPAPCPMRDTLEVEYIRIN